MKEIVTVAWKKKKKKKKRKTARVFVVMLHWLTKSIHIKYFS